MKKSGATDSQRLLVALCLDNGVPFFWRGPGTLLIKYSGLAAIMSAANSAGATLLGFEGFEMESTEVHPRIDLIYDATVRPEVQDPLSAISEWPEDIWVDVAVRV